MSRPPKVQAALDKARKLCDEVRTKVDQVDDVIEKTADGPLGRVLEKLPGIGAVVGTVQLVAEGVRGLADAVDGVIDALDTPADAPALPQASSGEGGSVPA